MGYDVGIHCHQCGYKFEATYGTGFLYSDLYAETMKNALKGKYGVGTAKFMWRHPDAAINAAYTAYICTECNNLQSELELGLYLPKGAQKSKRSKLFQNIERIFGKNNNYVDVSSPRDDFQLAKPYKHVCRKCNGIMEELTSDALLRKIERHELKCPQCENVFETLLPLNTWD